MGEVLKHHRLSHRQRPQISLKAKALNRWNFDL